MERLLGMDELQPGERASVFVDDIPALLVRTEDSWFVIEDLCSHDGQPLTDGPVEEGAIMCPRHGAKFDLKTGAALCMPATRAIRVFSVQLRDGAVWAGPEAPEHGDATNPYVTEQVNPASTSTPAASADEGESAPVEGPSDKSGSSPNDYIDALKQVIDPELMINIVDLGLVYSVEQDEENERRVCVEMTLTSPACPAGPQIVQQAKMSLERLHDVDEAAIKMVMSPPWTPERMTDDAKDQLGVF